MLLRMSKSPTATLLLLTSSFLSKNHSQNPMNFRSKNDTALTTVISFKSAGSVKNLALDQAFLLASVDSYQSFHEIFLVLISATNQGIEATIMIGTISGN